MSTTTFWYQQHVAHILPYIKIVYKDRVGKFCGAPTETRDTISFIIDQCWCCKVIHCRLCVRLSANRQHKKMHILPAHEDFSVFVAVICYLQLCLVACCDLHLRATATLSCCTCALDTYWHKTSDGWLHMKTRHMYI